MEARVRGFSTRKLPLPRRPSAGLSVCLSEVFKALDCCEECLPGRQTRTYPEQAVSDVSHHLVDLVRGQQLQREGAPLVLDGQLQGLTTVSARLTLTCCCRRRT